MGEKFQAGRAMTIKLWNAARYAEGHCKRLGMPVEPFVISDHPDDIMLYLRLRRARKLIGDHLENLEYHLAAHEMRRFLYDDFCGWYIEASKSRLYEENNTLALESLMSGLDQTRRMFHPLMPFITERIWSFYSNRPLITDSFDDS